MLVHTHTAIFMAISEKSFNFSISSFAHFQFCTEVFMQFTQCPSLPLLSLVLLLGRHEPGLGGEDVALHGPVGHQLPVHRHVALGRGPTAHLRLQPERQDPDHVDARDLKWNKRI